MVNMGQGFEWQKPTFLVKILKKLKTLKPRPRSGPRLSDSEIFIDDLETKTHPEGIHDVIDDFVTWYNMQKKGSLVLEIMSTPDHGSPPALPRRRAWPRPPGRPSTHPCQNKCQCITSL